MNIFDIVGPVMVGPSSSHTAGVVRIGNVVNQILGEPPKTVHIKFHGSFAKTYVGHGSDKAIIGGLLGFLPHDKKIRDSFSYAKEINMKFTFDTIELSDAHPNTIIVEGENSKGESIKIKGESVGGGNIVIRQINDIPVEFNGQHDTLIVSHSDTTGVVTLVTSVLSVERLNIAKMLLYRSERGGDAIMIIEIDGKLEKTLEKTLEVMPHIITAKVISKLQ